MVTDRPRAPPSAGSIDDRSEHPGLLSAALSRSGQLSGPPPRHPGQPAAFGLAPALHGLPLCRPGGARLSQNHAGPGGLPDFLFHGQSRLWHGADQFYGRSPRSVGTTACARPPRRQLSQHGSLVDGPHLGLYRCRHRPLTVTRPACSPFIHRPQPDPADSGRQPLSGAQQL